jgi:D-tyrosyl-tRNA(Tyr) deacylase
VSKASCEVDGKITGKIDNGFMVLVGITHDDTKENADFLAKKLCNLRVFEDENEKMNLNIKQVGGKLLVISQFTLYADTTQGNRPSFINAAKPDYANDLYEYFMEKCKEEGLEVEKGIFGAHMNISLVNSGPVTIMLEK